MLQDIPGFCYTTSGIFRSTGDVVPEHLRAHRCAFSLSGSIWAHLEGSVWLFRVTELFGYDFQTIIHFADVLVSTLKYLQFRMKTVIMVVAVKLRTRITMYLLQIFLRKEDNYWKQK